MTISSAAFAAVYPPYLFSASLVLTEVPFLTFFTAMLYAQVRALQEQRLRDHAIAGLLLGICVLIRPNVLPLAVVPYFLLWTREKKAEWRGALLGAGMFALVMLPWWVRNWLTFHEFIFISKGEAGNPFLGGMDPYFRGTIDWSKLNEKEQFAEGLQRIKQGVHDDPMLWLGWMTVGKFAVFFKTMWSGDYLYTVPGWYFRLLEKLHQYVIWLGWASALALAPWSRSIRVLLLPLVLFLTVHMAFIPVDRYSYGMLPFLMLFTANFAISGAGLLWIGCKQATRIVLARR